MRIAILTTTYFPESNGASIRTEGIAEGLQKYGNEISIIVPGKTFSKEQGKHAIIYRIPVKKSRIANFLEKYTKENKARYNALMKYVPQILKEEKIEIIHTRQPFDLFKVGRAMQQRLHIKWATEAHKLLSITDYENKLMSKRKYQKVLQKEVMLLNESDLVVTMTDAGKETLESKGVTTKIIPVENATSINPSATHAFKFEKDMRYLLYAGAIREVEAVDELIRCFYEVHQRVAKIKLLIIGKGDINSLRRLAKELCIEKEVIFLGEIPFENMGYFYKHATVFVHARPELTYHKDIIGLKFYDAIKCGLPLVVSGIGKLGRWVKEKKIGLTFSPGNQEAFHQTIEKILADKRLYQEIKKKVKSAGKNLTWKNTCKELNQMYKRIGKLKE